MGHSVTDCVHRLCLRHWQQEVEVAIHEDMQVGFRALRRFNGGSMVGVAPGPTPTTSLQVAAAAMDIRVVSYNLLADKYATGGMHAYCPPEYLAWPRRCAMIKEELEGYGAHIVCLQEVENDVFHGELQPWFQLRGMQGWFMARQSGEVQGQPEGIALFVSEQCFEVIKTAAVQFSDHAQAVTHTADTGSEGWRVFTQKEEGALMVLLRHKATKQHLIAASTHLFWNPKFPDVKALQAGVLCSRLAAFVSDTAHIHHRSQLPIILGGDFNSLPWKRRPDVFDRVIPPGPDGLVSGVYTLLSTGRLRQDHPDYPFTRQDNRERPGTPPAKSSLRHRSPLNTQGLVLQSMHVQAHGREPALTTKTATFAGCLDYIWLTPQWLKVKQVLDLPYEEPRADITDPHSTQSVAPQRVQSRASTPALHVCSASSSSSNRDGHSAGGPSSPIGIRQQRRRAKAPGLFEVKVVTPPPRSLGIYSLPPLTHNGELIDIDGEGFVVTSVSIQMKLLKGKYVRDHSRLDVQPTGRYFLNMTLDSLLRAKYIGPTGEQD